MSIALQRRASPDAQKMLLSHHPNLTTLSHTHTHTPAEFTKERNVHTFPRSLYISSHIHTQFPDLQEKNYIRNIPTQEVFNRSQKCRSPFTRCMLATNTRARDKAATHVHNMKWTFETDHVECGALEKLGSRRLSTVEEHEALWTKFPTLTMKHYGILFLSS